MRGKRRPNVCYTGNYRNIPAYAGKTKDEHYKPEVGEEHPRVCGENLLNRVVRGFGGGTSPRMRGKHPSGAAAAGLKRNIPAYAGKTPCNNITR